MKVKLIKTVLVLLLSALCTQIDAQTVIKETVKIKPIAISQKLVKSMYSFLPCKPWPHTLDSITAGQVVWAGNTYAIDPGQQPLWKQENSFLPYTRVDALYKIEVIEGGSIVEFYKYKQNFDNYGNQLDDSVTIVTPPLENIYGYEIRGNGSEWVESCDFDYNLSFHTYLMKFKPGMSGIVKIKYVQNENDFFFVTTYVVNPTYHLKSPEQVDTTYHNHEYCFSPGFAVNECADGCMPAQYPTVVSGYEIISGQEYGILYNRMTKEAGNSVTGLQGDVCFIANGINPKTEEMVTVKASSSITQSIDVSFIVKHYEGIVPGINVSFSKTELAAGDTVDLVVKKYIGEIAEGHELVETDFNWGTTFEAGILEGCEIGEILTADGRRGSYFRDLQLPIKFIVGQSIAADSALLKIRVAADEPEGQATKIAGRNYSTGITNSINFSIKSMNTSSRTTKKESSCTSEEFYLGNYRIAETSQVTHSILLGETKYYGLLERQSSDKIEYKIEEIICALGSVPRFTTEKETDNWHWMKSDVWGDNPVTKISGTESVVYWEKKGPNGNSLLPGIIRIIGRYWVESIEQKVKLNDIDNRAKIEIKVKKPGKLGNTAPIILDVFDQSVKINDLCIDMGGKNGIPPQLIKGQMEEESSFRNAYRYEPFKDIYYQTIDLVNKKNMFNTYTYFTVTETSTGTVAIPSHDNVKPVEYPGSTYIKDYLYKYIMQYVKVVVDKNEGMYKAKTDIIGYPDEKPLEDILQISYYRKIKTVKKKENESLPYTALKEAADTLKLLIQGGELPGSNLIAQTRIVASYGLLQQTFYNAADLHLLSMGYNNLSKPPEILNEISNSRNAYEERIEDKLAQRKHNNWTEGFEKGWIKVLSDYNGGGYSKRVSKNSEHYLPTNN